MIVSTATAVLPVWRSPMISSRWPRPMGIIESIALMPVCNGCFTGSRSMMPGAFSSMRREVLVLIGPLPSTGCPSAFTTRPRSASPTGTSAMRPVRRTSSPSLMSCVSPMMAAPTLSSSRFSASPKRPCGNSMSSPASTLSSP